MSSSSRGAIGSSRYRREVIRKLLKKHKYCYYMSSKDCPGRLDPTNATIDHYIPLAQGGRNVISNYVLSCKPCNEAKGSMMPIDFALSKK